ncbi:MAG: T9SS type A sorting domain-containing protein [Chitinophagales bacterium]
METRFTLTVLQANISPCTEKRENMDEHADGWFCHQCSKVVHDLSDLSKDELITYLNENPGICGQVKTTALNRPVIQLDRLDEPHVFRLRFAVALFLVFGSLLFSCTEKQEKDIGKSLEQSFLESHLEGEYEMERVTGFAIAREYHEDASSAHNIFSTNDSIIDKQTDTAEIDLETVIINDRINRYGNINPNTFDSIGWSSTGILNIEIIKKLTILPEDTAMQIETPTGDVDIHNLLVFPNPAMRSVTIEYTIGEESNVLLEVFDLTGKRVVTVQNTIGIPVGEYYQELYVQDWPSGMYLAVLLHNDEKEIFRFQVTH